MEITCFMSFIRVSRILVYVKDVMPCNMVDIDLHFRGCYCLYQATQHNIQKSGIYILLAMRVTTLFKSYYVGQCFHKVYFIVSFKFFSVISKIRYSVSVSVGTVLTRILKRVSILTSSLLDISWFFTRYRTMVVECTNCFNVRFSWHFTQEYGHNLTVIIHGSCFTKH